MGIFRTNSEFGKPIRTWPLRLNTILQSICEALGIQMDQEFSGPQCITISQKGAPNGVCELDGTGKVPLSRLIASTQPQASVLPITGPNGKLHSGFVPATALDSLSLNMFCGQVQPGTESVVTLSSPQGSLSSWFDSANNRIIVPQGNTILVNTVMRFNMRGVVAVKMIETNNLVQLMCSAPAYDNQSLFGSSLAASFVWRAASAPIYIKIRLRIDWNFPESSYVSSLDSQSYLQLFRI